LRHNFPLCGNCRNELPKIDNYCTKCCSELDVKVEAPTQENANCAQCLKNPLPFRHCRALFRYQPPVSNLLRSYKFDEGFAEGRVLSLLLAKEFQRHYSMSNLPDILIPVPLHRNRLRKRGFNQAAEIAKTISGECGVPVSLNHVIKSIDTVPQSELSKLARHKNLRNVFSVSSGTDFQAVKSAAIIDDVVTTTTTVASVAKALQSAGIKTIDVWAIARTSLTD
jgi:ComF family protein